MNSIKRLERMMVRGEISQEEYLEYIGAYRKSQEIIAYLQAEMDEAIELHDATKDVAQRLSLMLKAYTISELLDNIKE
jgi:hypothetical protein